MLTPKMLKSWVAEIRQHVRKVCTELFILHVSLYKMLQLLLRCIPGCAPFIHGSSIYVHLNFAGPFLGRMFMIVVDVHSKYGNEQYISQVYHHRVE